MKITFHLKSGKEITVLADNLEIKQQYGNNITSYSLSGMKRPYDLFYVRIEDISAITTEE